MRLGVALATFLLAAAAAAQPLDYADAEARRHFARGSASFKLGDYEQALAEFRAAYSLGQAPGLLFNMGQASRGARKYELAGTYYRAYLRLVPDAPERKYIEERLRDMRVATAPEPAPPEPAAAPPPPPRDESQGRVMRIVGMGSAAAGVGLAVTAVWFGRRASGAADEVSTAFADHRQWSPELEELYARGRRDENVAVVTGITGGVLAVGGVVLWYLGAREGRRARLTTAPTAHGVEVQASWAF